MQEVDIANHKVEADKIIMANAALCFEKPVDKVMTLPHAVLGFRLRYPNPTIFRCQALLINVNKTVNML